MSLDYKYYLYNYVSYNNIKSKAESARQAQALAINISAARGLAEMLKTNLGPKGTMKMYIDISFRFHAIRNILRLYQVLVILK